MIDMFQFRNIKPTELSEDQVSFWRKAALILDPQDSPLLSPEYCLQIAESRNDVEIGIVENAQELVGILPFHRKANGRGRPIGDEITDLHGFLLADSNPNLRKWIQGFGLDSFDFDHLCGTVAREFVFRFDKCYRINLATGFEDYISQIKASSSIIADSARKRRKLSREVGNVDFVWEFTDQQTIEQLIQWKTQTLQDKNQKSPFSKWVIKLIHDLINEPKPKCHGILSGLRVNGEVAALHFGVANTNFVSSWIPCINPKFDKFSVGSILYLELAKHAAEIGVRYIDLGRGENQTKVRLANDSISLGIGSVCKSPLRQWAKHRWDDGKQFVKRSHLYRVLKRATLSSLC